MGREDPSRDYPTPEEARQRFAAKENRRDDAGEPRTRVWLTSAGAGSLLHEVTGISVANIRKTARQRQHERWDARLFAVGHGRPAPAPKPGTATTAAVAAATTRLADAVRLHRHLCEIAQRPVPDDGRREAVALATLVVPLLREFGMPQAEKPGVDPAANATMRAKKLASMAGWSAERLQSVAGLAADVEGVLQDEADLATLLRPRDRHRPAAPFGWLCRVASDALATTGFTPDKADDQTATRLVALFVAAMDLVPRTPRSHDGPRVHLPRLLKRVKQALNRRL